jgi:hypothetical protein
MAGEWFCKAIEFVYDFTDDPSRPMVGGGIHLAIN